VGELESIYVIIKSIMETTYSWELKYDMIFNDRVSGKVFELISMDYYDPDTSYQEDVQAFYNALTEYMEKTDG
jgi:hypothetical protein